MRFVWIFVVLPLAGCAGEGPEAMPQSLADEPPGVGWLSLRGAVPITSRACVDADLCAAGLVSTVLDPILPNVTARSLTLNLSAGEPGWEVDWELLCYEQGCPRTVLASGRDVIPFSIDIDPLDLSGFYARLRLEPTNTVAEKPGVLQWQDIRIEGGARVEWGPPLVEVQREHVLTLTTQSCLEPSGCNPLSGQPSRFDIQGIVTSFELDAVWSALTSTESQLEFSLLCDFDECGQQYRSGPVASPAHLAGEVGLMGQPGRVTATVSYAGLVGNAAGSGTEVRVVLRTTELVRAA